MTATTPARVQLHVTALRAALAADPDTLLVDVRLVAGGIVATSVLASIRAPRLRFVAGAIGVGLVTAAVTDTCGLAMLLARLPWSRSSATDVDAEIDAAVALPAG